MFEVPRRLAGSPRDLEHPLRGQIRSQNKGAMEYRPNSSPERAFLGPNIYWPNFGHATDDPRRVTPQTQTMLLQGVNANGPMVLEASGTFPGANSLHLGWPRPKC